MIKVIVGKNNFDRHVDILEGSTTPAEAITAAGFAAEAEGKTIYLTAVPLKPEELYIPLETLAPGKDTVFLSWDIKTPDNA